MAHLPAHLCKQFMDCIDLQIARLKSLQRISDRHLLGYPHQQRRFRIALLRFRQLLQHAQDCFPDVLFRAVKLKSYQLWFRRALRPELPKFCKQL